jgi:hypothetical protein
MNKVIENVFRNPRYDTHKILMNRISYRVNNITFRKIREITILQVNESLSREIIMSLTKIKKIE